MGGDGGQETRRSCEGKVKSDEKPGLAIPVYSQDKDVLCIAKRGDGRDSLGLPVLLCASRQVPG